MKTTGGEHSLDGHIFEVYDRKQFLTITENVLINEPIREAQDLVDSLTS
jgi:hypothetical protein